MSASVQLGLVLALLTAFGSVAGFLYKFRGAREAPSVELRRPWHSTVELFRSPLYTLGIVIAFGSWGLHVGALTLAPISLVQSVIAGGLVLLTVVADRMFGIEVTRREWICVGLTAAGLAFLAATLDGDAGSAHSHYSPSTLAVYLLVLGAAATALVVVRASSTRDIAGPGRPARTRRCWPCRPGCCGRPLTPRSRRSARIWASSDSACCCIRSRS